MRGMNALGRLFIKSHALLYRLSGGKLGARMRGQPVLLLSTRGRKSGARRDVPVVPLIDGENVYVMGSLGGAPKHPAWFLNLQANPDVEVQLGPERWRAHAIVLADAERDQVWKRVTAAMPGFADYQKKTDRVIPVVRLARQG
jgi:deazaflavin-dependent oxidoreductase (nitroreductase family)